MRVKRACGVAEVDHPQRGAVEINRAVARAGKAGDGRIAGGEQSVEVVGRRGRGEQNRQKG